VDTLVNFAKLNRPLKAAFYPETERSAGKRLSDFKDFGQAS
jgi:hypothetical protein